jgi:energy-coupling factor transport system permease protein
MTDSAYRQGSGFLYLLDVRVKLLLLIFLIACLFSSSTLLRPMVITALWLLLALSVKGGVRDLWRVIKMFRWLLLFTLIMHLFFTPGQTLLGLSWLSYDGLLRGALINSQLLLAVVYSLLLSWTTEPDVLARGFESLLAPLKILKIPIREITGLFVLVLHFFPMIKAEIATEQEGMSHKRMNGLNSIKLWASRFEPILCRLFDRADSLAYDIANGNEPIGDSEVSTRKGFDGQSMRSLFIGLVAIGMLWQV